MPNVLIRDVDTDTYTSFKAKAAQEGLKLGEAITRAMKDWMEKNRPFSEKDKQRQLNLLTYRKLKETLLKEYDGMWVLIGRGEFLIAGDTLDPILAKIKALDLEGDHCFVFQVGKEVKKRTFGFGRRVQ
ncbi:MAG: hypothetical protein ACFFC7_33525 [Candidatus Hermodarchaeota archaeon]